jgi:hypothetical protein
MSVLRVRVEEVSDRHVAAYAALSYAEYGDHPMAQPAHLRWKFLENPQGASIGIHLFDEDELVGRLIAQPRVVVGGSSPARIAYMVDLLIHPAHRGIGALAALARGMREVKEHFDGILVTPNTAGAAVWRGLLRVTERFDLTLSGMLLRPSALWHAAPRSLERAAAAVDSVWRLAVRGGSSTRRVTLRGAAPADRDVDALLAGAARALPHGERSPAFFSWRYRQSPVMRYDLLWLYVGEALAGVLATRRVTYGGYDTRFVLDAIGAPEPSLWHAAARALLAREAARGGAQLVLAAAHDPGGPLAALRAPLFVPIPERFAPQRPTVFADWWTAPRFAWDGAHVALTLGDCDMI